MSAPGRAGFSVIEALVVLAISGTALLLIFEMGVSGSRTGFRLGNRALAATDAEPGAGGLRTIIRGARFDPPADDFRLAGPRGPEGGARAFSTPASLDRATACATAGPAAHLRLELERTEKGDVLTCARAPGVTPVVLMDFRPARAAFRYSEDGAAWRDSWRRATPPPDGRLFVRLTTNDGAVDIVEVADLADLTPSKAVGGAP